jgi:hypothetical protein
LRRVRIDERVQEEVGEVASEHLFETHARRDVSGWDVLGPRPAPDLGGLGH